MAYTTPVAATAAELITVQKFNEQIMDNISFLANPPACRVYNSGTIAHTNDTEKLLTFDSERFDTDSMHSTLSNTSRITINTAGIYVVTTTAAWSAGSDYIYIMLRHVVNGATYIGSTQAYPEAGGNTVDTRLSLTSVYKFAAGDYVETTGKQRNGASASRTMISGGNFTPEFSAVWIGLG